MDVQSALPDLDMSIQPTTDSLGTSLSDTIQTIPPSILQTYTAEIDPLTLDRSKIADKISADSAKEFLDDLRPYTAVETKPFIKAIKNMAMSGSWEPTDSKKTLIWYVLENRFFTSPSEDERALSARLLVELRKQDAEARKALLDAMEKLMSSELSEDAFKEPEQDVFQETDKRLSIRSIVSNIEAVQEPAE